MMCHWQACPNGNCQVFSSCVQQPANHSPGTGETGGMVRKAWTPCRVCGGPYRSPDGTTAHPCCDPPGVTP